MYSTTSELHRRRALRIACVLLLTASLAGCREATAPSEPTAQDPAPGPFGASLGPGATSPRKVLDLVALRACLELGAERDWTSSEVERLDPLFDAATARSTNLEQWLETPPPTMDANELLRRIAWRRELARLAKEREEIGGVLPRHLTRFVEANNEFMKDCEKADYREADLRTLSVDYFPNDESAGTKR